MHNEASYPQHPDSVIVTKKENPLGKQMTEKDVWSYYEGVKTELIKELKGKDLFIVIKAKTGTIIVRRPFKDHSEFIRIGNEKEFENYHTGRFLEYHITMPAMCPYYVIDFDSVATWENTKKITAELADGLGKLPEVKSIELRFSGKRGFHILGWLKKAKPIDKAREDLKEWLKENFGDRKDLVVAESPVGFRGALGVAPMKLNGGQTAKWSLRTTGLCCIEVPRSKLMFFNKEEALPENVYKKVTGEKFMSVQKKTAASKIINAYLELEAGGYGPSVEEAFRGHGRKLLVEPKAPTKPADPSEPFARAGEIVSVLNSKGEWVNMPWTTKMEEVRKSGC